MENKHFDPMPLHKDGKRLSRQFDGKTEGFKDKQEQAFYQKMLRYYCKGAEQMPHSREMTLFGWKPTYVPVQQSYYYV